MKQTEEELLEYARLNYPIGTRYIPAHVNFGINEIVDTNYSFYKPHIHVNSTHIQGNYNNCIYYYGNSYWHYVYHFGTLILTF